MGLTSRERQAQKRISNAQKAKEQASIKERSEPLSSFAKEAKDRIQSGQTYKQAISGASERRKVTDRDEFGAPTFGDKAPDPSILAAQQQAEQEKAQQRLVDAQRRGNIESLRGAEKTALGATGRQREKTVEEAFGQRRGIKTQAKQSERTLAQYLASRGLGRSGAAVGGQIAQNVTLQEGIAQARGQESARLGDILQSETDIKTQTASGIAQAGQQAEAQRAQLEIANIQQRAQQAQQTQQLQASRDFEQQQFERNQNAQIQQEQRQQDFERAQAEIDLAIKEARRVQDFAREDQLIEMKQQNAITLKQTVGGGTISRSGGSGNGSDFTDRQLVSDAVRGLNEIDQALSGQPRSLIETRKAEYIQQLQQAGYSPANIQQIIISSGLSGNTGGDSSVFGQGLRQ